jgi:hypothetical protein
LAAHPFWVARGSGLLSDDQRRISAAAHVRIFGDTWVVDQREPAAPLDAYSLNEREPTALEWLIFGGTEPTRSIGGLPDPWLTWEWRTHLGQRADLPAGEPITIDQMRIAHNMAVDRGDTAAAQGWRARIEAQLDRSVGAPFDQALRLVGVRVTQGVQPRVESWFECGAPIPSEAFFQVRSTVERRASWSLIPPDLTDREMAWPASLPTRLWRAHWLYVAEAVLNHRIGVERYWGYWTSRDVGSTPRRMDGQAETTLAILP